MPLSDDGISEPSSGPTQPETPTRSFTDYGSPASAASTSLSPPGSKLASASELTAPVRNLSDNSRFATHRLSPLVCPNQSLLLELGIIMKSRTLDGNTRSALSYSRAISVGVAFNSDSLLT